MQAHDGRQALQVLHRERQRTVHQAVDHQGVLPGIDVRQEGPTRGRHVVERGRRDHAHGILKRGRHMKHEAEGIGRRPSAVRNAHRSDEMGPLAVCDQLLAAPDHLRGRWFRRWCLASRRRYRSQRQTTSQRGAALEEFPSIKSFRTHRSLLRKSDCQEIASPRSRVYARFGARHYRLRALTGSRDLARAPASFVLRGVHFSPGAGANCRLHVHARSSGYDTFRPT